MGVISGWKVKVLGAAAAILIASVVIINQPRIEAAGELLTQAEVDAIVAAALAQAAVEPSALRVNSTGVGQPTRMHIAVVDRNGKLRALTSQGDAWAGSIAIAKAKAYTAAAFSSDENALTTRSIGALSQPGGPLWQIGNSNQVRTGAGDDGVVQQGLIEFPGGLPLYKNGKLVGGIGVSGDVVDADEDVAEAGGCGFQAPSVIRIDTVAALPYVVAGSFTCP